MSKEGTPISQEDTPRKIERIKRHVKENKERYLIGASYLIIGGSAGVAGAMLGRKVKVSAIAKNTALVNWRASASVVQETVINMPAKADRGHVVIDAITGTPVGASITDAARNEGLSRAAMLKNLRGLTDFAPNGKKYVDLGENLSEQVRITL